MLTNKQSQHIKNRMKYTHTCGSNFARELNLTRQAVNLIINRKGNSERIEKHLREWNKKTIINRVENDSKNNK